MAKNQLQPSLRTELDTKLTKGEADTHYAPVSLADDVARKAPLDTGLIPQDWAHWGDSLTAGSGPTTWVGKLATATGRNHYNGGVGGQSVVQIAARQGGVPGLVTVTGNAIPASGPVAVTSIVRTPLDPNGSVSGMLAGVSGTLARDGGANHTFTRTAAGEVTPCPQATPFVTNVALANRSRKFTLCAGRNGYKDNDITSIAASIRAMRGYLTNAQGLVLDVLPWVGEEMPAASGSAREKLNALNALLRSEFPAEFLNAFELLRTPTAAQAAGIIFTADDQTDITNGLTPRSLRSDEGI